MNRLLTGGVVLAVVLSGLAFFGTDGVDGKDGRDGRTGAQSGPENYDTNFFFENFYTGNGSTATTSDVAAATVTSQWIDCDTPYVSWLANLDVAITFQASTSEPFVGMKKGQACSVYVYSATTSAATTMTWTAGTGIDLLEPEINGTVIQNGGDFARITFVKKADTDIAVVTEIFQVGD